MIREMPRIRENPYIDPFKFRIAALDRLSDEELNLFSVDERPVYLSKRLKKLENLALTTLLPETAAQKHFVDVFNSQFWSSTILYGKKEALYLNCPYSDKDAAMGLGARWDESQRQWYVPNGLDKAQFRKWWPKYKGADGGAGPDSHTVHCIPETPHEFAFLKYWSALLDEVKKEDERLNKEAERSDQLERAATEQLNYVQQTRLGWRSKARNSGEQDS